MSGSLGPRSRGFTLVEVLVVLTLLGILLGAVALSLERDDEKRVAQAAERFTQFMRYAQMRATIAERPFGIAMEGRRYRLVEFRDGRWRVPPAGPAARSGRFPDGIAGHIARELRSGDEQPVLVFTPARESPAPPVYLVDAQARAGVVIEAVSLTRYRVSVVDGGGA